MTSKQSDTDMGIFNSYKSVIEAVLQLPNPVAIHQIDVDYEKEFSRMQLSAKRHFNGEEVSFALLRLRTKNHILYAKQIGCDDVVMALYGDVCKGRMFEVHEEYDQIIDETTFVQLMRKHIEMFNGRELKELAKSNDLGSEYMYLQRSGNGGTDESLSAELAVIEEKEARQRVVCRYIASLLDMFECWVKCTHWVYQRNRIILECKNRTGRVLSPNDCIDKVTDLNEMLLSSARDTCLALLHCLKQSVCYKVYKEPLLHPNTVLQCVAMTLVYVPEYLKKKLPTSLDESRQVQFDINKYIAPLHRKEEAKLRQQLYTQGETSEDTNDEEGEKHNNAEEPSGHLYDPAGIHGDDGLSMLILNDVYPSRCIISLDQQWDWTAQL